MDAFIYTLIENISFKCVLPYCIPTAPVLLLCVGVLFRRAHSLMASTGALHGDSSHAAMHGRRVFSNRAGGSGSGRMEAGMTLEDRMR